MMRLLYFSDLHLAERPPSQRTTDYADLLFEKLAEIRDAAQDVDLTLFGGDWWHWNHPPHATSHRLVQRLIGFLREWPTQIVTSLGNHDCPSDGAAGIDRMPLGVILQALRPEDLDYGLGVGEMPGTLVCPDGPVRVYREDVEIVPFHWTPERDREPRSELFRHAGRGAGVVVAMTHAMIMPPGGGWPFPALGMEEIASSEIDLVLLGHVHWRTPLQRWGPTLFAGPGAVARTQRTPGEMERRPAYAIITIEDGQVDVEFKPIECARPAAEVFALLAPQEKRGEMFEGYVQLLEAGLQVDSRPLEEIIEGLEAKASPRVAALVREYLTKAELGR